MSLTYQVYCIEGQSMYYVYGYIECMYIYIIPVTYMGFMIIYILATFYAIEHYQNGIL